MLLDRSKHLLFQPRSEAWEGPELLLLAEFLETVDRRDAEMLDQQGDGLRPKSLNFEEFECGRGESLQELVALLERSPFDDFTDYGRDAFPDPGNIGQLAIGTCRDVGDPFGIALDRCGGV